MLQDSIDSAESAAGHALPRGQVSQYWAAKARNYITSHPVAWLRLLALKLRNLWSAFQYDDLSIITILREQNVTLPGIYFGLVAALALPAIFLVWKTAPLSRWIAVGIALHVLALLPVFTTNAIVCQLFRAFLFSPPSAWLCFLIMSWRANFAGPLATPRF